MLRFGTITDVDAAKFMARVSFAEDNMVSDWLPIMVRGAIKVKDEFPIDVDDQVVCLMDDQDEDGVILGCIYSEDVAPDAGSKTKYQVKFDDGLIVTYDRQAKKFTYKLTNCELVITESGFLIKKSSDTLRKILTDLIDQIKLITVTTPNGPSGTPINATAFDPIKQSVQNLLTAS